MAATASTQPPALATETGHIEIDPSIEDRDSAYGDDEYGRGYRATVSRESTDVVKGELHHVFDIKRHRVQVRARPPLSRIQRRHIQIVRKLRNPRLRKKADLESPNDEAEQDRLDMFHEICKLLAGDTLALAPFKRDGSILDLGTGTGIWAIEAGMALFQGLRVHAEQLI